LYTNFTSDSGTNKSLVITVSTITKGNGFRPNSDFESKLFANLNYKFNDKTSLHFDYTYFTYLAQAGGLTDFMFNQNPKVTEHEIGLQ
jgi:Fe(3+) dicitrate transport protein